MVNKSNFDGSLDQEFFQILSVDQNLFFSELKVIATFFA